VLAATLHQEYITRLQRFIPNGAGDSLTIPAQGQHAQAVFFPKANLFEALPG
jgi:hypothetical protein